MNDKLREALVIANALQNAITEELAASKPEPQAQAGYPPAWRCGDHEFRKINGDWELHYLLVDDGIPQRYCDDMESAMLEAIAKKDAALKACVEALESYSKSPYVKKQHPKRHAAGNAAIKQAKEAME